MFTWMHEDIPGIVPCVAVHRINVDLASRPVKQKRNFALNRNQAITQ